MSHLAIGTAKNADPATANSIIGLSIRGAIADMYGEGVAQQVRCSTAAASSPIMSKPTCPNPT